MQTFKILGLSALVAATAGLAAEEPFHYDYATVLEAKPIIALVEHTRTHQECRPEVVRYKERRSNKGDKLVGTILGAAVGHALGHRSKHRGGATVAGAIIGNQMADNGKVVVKEHVEQRCRTIPTTWKEEQIVGYNVVYRYNGRTFESRLPYNPGDSMRIRVALTPIPEGQTSGQQSNYDPDYD